MAVGVNGSALDDGEDVIAIALSIGETLEHQNAGGIRADDTVGVVGESVDSAGRGDNSKFAKTSRGMRSSEDINAAGQSYVRGTCAQVIDGLANSDQRGRACSVHVDGRATQVQCVGDAVGHHCRRGAGHGIRVHLCRVSDDEHAVVIVSRTHVHARCSAAQLVGWKPCVLERFPS